MAGKLLFPIPERGLNERLYRIRAKTVIVWGENDRMIPAAHGHAFRRGITGAELISVSAAGHMVIVEQPDAVVAALTRLN
jgi:pimeloyl-ACP methyl ester carboxylesterase